MNVHSVLDCWTCESVVFLCMDKVKRMAQFCLRCPANDFRCFTFSVFFRTLLLLIDKIKFAEFETKINLRFTRLKLHRFNFLLVLIMYAKGGQHDWQKPWLAPATNISQINSFSLSLSLSLSLLWICCTVVISHQITKSTEFSIPILTTNRTDGVFVL